MANDLSTMQCRVQIPLCSYPSSFDNLVNPLSDDYLNLPPHDVQHAMTNDILLALEKTLGTGGVWSSRFSTGLSVSAANVVTLASDIPTATTIGSAYIYRVGGTDVAIADGGTNASSFANSNGLIYYNGTSLVADTAALTSGRVPYATTNGRLTDSANLTYAGSVLQNAGNIRTAATGNYLVAGYSTANDQFACVMGFETGKNARIQLGNNSENQLRAGDQVAGGYFNFYTGNTAAYNADTNGILGLGINRYGHVGIGYNPLATTDSSARNLLCLGTGTAPTSSPSDSVQLYSGDIFGLAGFAGLSIRGEGGGITAIGDAIDWGAGNVIYVPIGLTAAQINAYITAAAIGDTLVLASGTYTITSTITVNKAINIVGQGIWTGTSGTGTLVTCATVGESNFTVSSSNVRIANLSIVNNPVTSSSARGITMGTGSNLSGLVFENLEVTISGPNNHYGINIIGSNTTIRDCVISVTSSDSYAVGIGLGNNGSTTQNAVVDIYNTKVTVTGSATLAYGYQVYNSNDANTVTMNLYNCIGIANAGTAADYAIAPDSATTFNSIMNVYGGSFNGQDADAYCGGTNSLTLHNVELVNNKTSGTITYAGAVVSAAAKMGYDTNTTSYLGRNAMGFISGLSDFASLAHIDCNNSTDYALIQNNVGTTWLNAKTGNLLNLCINSSAVGYISSQGFGIGTSTWGTSAKNTLAVKSGTAPTTSPADAVQLYSADADGVAGYARLHVRGEDGNAVPLGMNLINHAKAQLIEAVYEIVTDPANVVYFAIFDVTGAATTGPVDRSTIGGTTAHTTTLSANASTLSPSIAGMCPNLNVASSAYFYITDAADLTFGLQAFSIVALINPNNTTSRVILAKDDITTGTTKREYNFMFDESQYLSFQVHDNDAGGRIARYYDSARTADIGTWHTYSATYDGGTASTGMNIYRDGVVVDNQDNNSGSFTTMRDTTSIVGNYFIFTDGNRNYIGSSKYGVVLIVKEELSALQNRRLDAVLRAYAGSNLN